MNAQHSFAPLFLLVLLVITIFPVVAADPVTGCMVISSPGSYLLQTDILNSPATYCIHIQSSDVLFDGNGFTIDGLDSASSWGMYLNNASFTISNITVLNTTFTDWGPFDSGIEGWHAGDCTIMNNTVTSSGTGISLGYGSDSLIRYNNVSGNSGDGIVVTFSDNVTVTDNTANNDDVIGFALQNVNGSTFRSNTARNNGQAAIRMMATTNCAFSDNTLELSGIGIDVSDLPSIGSSYGNTFLNNNINSNLDNQISLANTTGNGIVGNTLTNQTTTYPMIDLVQGSRLNYIADNTISGGTIGITVSLSDSNTVLNNHLSGMTGYGIATSLSDNTTLRHNDGSGNNYLIYLSDSQGNTIVNNTAAGNAYGFGLSNASYNTFRDNIITGSTIRGISFFASAPASISNIFSNNYLNNANNTGWAGSIGTNQWNGTTTAGPNIVNGPLIAGNYWEQPNGLGFSQTCTDGDGDGICDSAYTLASNNIDNLPLTSVSSGWDGISCTEILTPGTYEVLGDIVTSAEIPCIEIRSSDVILEGNGHTLDGTTDSGYGVEASGFPAIISNVTVRNLIISNWDRGITYENVTGGTIDSTTASSNANDGILLINAMGNTLTANTVSSNGNDGIFISAQSRGNNLSDNIAELNGMDGFAVIRSRSNNLTRNTARNNVHIGINLDRAENTTVYSNTLSGNDHGILLYFARNNTITSNAVTANNEGFRVLIDGNNRFTSNTVTANTLGFWVNASQNDIFNNYFDNTNNAVDGSSAGNRWNTTRTAGINILGGAWLGGNSWNDYAGTDTGGDGIGDTLVPYTAGGNIAMGGDWLPLVPAPTAPVCMNFTACFDGDDYITVENGKLSMLHSDYGPIGDSDGTSTNCAGFYAAGYHNQISIDGIFYPVTYQSADKSYLFSGNPALDVGIVNLDAFDFRAGPGFVSWPADYPAGHSSGPYTLLVDDVSHTSGYWFAGAHMYTIDLCGNPVTSPASVIDQSATLYIGEEGLNVTHALNQAQGNPALDGVPPLTTIGWWASGSEVGITAPSRTIDLSGRYTSLTVTPADFVGYSGNWYVLQADGVHVTGVPFTVADPALNIRVWDFDHAAYVTGTAVPRGTRLGFRIDTNLYGATAHRSPLDPATDGFIDIRVVNPSVLTYGALYHYSTNEGALAGPGSLLANYVDVQPYYWGSPSLAWNTSARDNGAYIYPAGTYTVRAESTLHNMRANYQNYNADFVGKTVSPSYTITIVSGSGLSPVAFTANTTSGTAPLAVLFTDASSVISPLMWNWSFGDNTWFVTTDSAARNPSHRYPAGGTYSVSLTVTNASGRYAAVLPGPITVAGSGVPAGGFTASTTSGTAPLAVQFTDTSSVASPLMWNWSFGDGTWFNTTDSAARNPGHLYLTDGTYIVSLTVTNAFGSYIMTGTGPITVTSGGGGGGTGGGGYVSSDDVWTGPVAVVPVPAVQPPAIPPAQPPDIPVVTEQGVSMSYPVGFPGLIYNEKEQNILVINLAGAKIAGATVTQYFNRVEVYQHHSPGVLLTFWGDRFEIINGNLTGKVTRAELATDPLNAALKPGNVSGSVQAVLPALITPGRITSTLSDNVSAGTLARFAEIAKSKGLEVPRVAFTFTVQKVNLKTGPANMTFSVPASWVTTHGSRESVRIGRISDETGRSELLKTTYIGTDTGGIMTFRGDSPNGTSLFGLFTAEATTARQKEQPNLTYVPISKPAMVTNVGMFEWLAGQLITNPLLILAVIAVLAAALYFGWWRRRL